MTTSQTITNTWVDVLILDRNDSDVFRKATLEATTLSQDTGGEIREAERISLQKMQNQSITAFTDASGRN